MSLDSKSVSIIVPTLNNERTVGVLLESISRQTYPHTETIVVDGGSSDATARTAVDLGFKVITYPARGDQRGHARNLGAQVATGDILLFLDSDMELPPDAVADCAARIEAGCDAVVIPEVNLGVGLIGRVRLWERALVANDSALSFARAMRSDLFRSAGGFDEGIIGFEDIDLQATLIAMSVRLGTSSAKILHHEEPLTLVSYLIKRRHYRETSQRYREKHPDLSREVFSPLARIKLYATGLRSLQDIPLFAMSVLLRLVESV